MSMRDYPCCGYTYKLSSLLSYFTQKEQKRISELIVAGDKDELELFINKIFDKNNLPLCELVVLDEDTAVSDDLEYGEYYLVFSPQDLYVMTPNTAGNLLERLAGKAQFAMWTQWG